MKTINAKAVQLKDLDIVESAVDKLDPSTEMAQVLHEVLAQIRQGTTVRFIPDDGEVTPNEAAKLLGVSRPTVLKLLAANELPARIVGSRDQRIPLSAVLDFKKRQSQASRDVAAAFANKTKAQDQLVAVVAGVDADLARELGY